jgi:hypothetical protein
MPNEPEDWVDDDSMSAAETLRRFEALNPVETTGPREGGVIELQTSELDFSDIRWRSPALQHSNSTER